MECRRSLDHSCCRATTTTSMTMPCSGARSGAMRSGGSPHGIVDHWRCRRIRCCAARGRQAGRARRRHEDYRSRNLRRRVAFRRARRNDPPDQVHAGPRTASRLRRPRAYHRPGRGPSTQHGRPRFPSHSVGPSLRTQPRAIGPPPAAVGRALVDPGRRAGDDRGRRQPRQTRPEGRCACRRAHSSGRDRCAGQLARSAISTAFVDILSIDALSDGEIAEILSRAAQFFTGNRGRRSAERLHGKIVFNLFYENSTRTAMSFATAAHRLGASAISLSVERSSVQKGETLEDTARTLNAMRPDALVIRHRENGAPAAVALVMDAPVLNAGDGTNEHPTQALLDAATIQHRLGNLEGLKVAICGDIRHSRVARSSAKLLPRLGAEVRLAGPPSLMPDGIPPLLIDDAICGADVVMMLRVQRERLEEDLGDAPGEYLARYGLTRERLATASPQAVVMHPGPMNRGVEIDSGIADDPDRSLITLQVEMGVAVRMACLEIVVGSTASSALRR